MAKKILIIEDEESIRRTLSKKLTIEGFDVIEAENGEVGLNKILQEKPDLILLDIVMPVMDGLTMLKKLCKEKCDKNLNIILLTNLNSPEKIVECFEKGVYEYLIKTDWQIDDVVKKVKEKLGL